MGIEETMFFISMLIIIAMTLIKIYNVASNGEFLSGRITAMVSFTFYIFYFIAFNAAIIEHSTLLITQIYKLAWILFMINNMLVIIETMIYIVKYFAFRHKQHKEKNGFFDPKKAYNNS